MSKTSHEVPRVLTSGSQRIVAVLLVSGVVLFGVGCSSAPEPVVIPEVVWPDGEPTGPLESDEWVVAMREGLMMLDVASNARNFDFPELYAANDRDLVFKRMSSVEGAIRAGEPVVFPGPRPMVPMNVDVTEGGRKAVVRVCQPWNNRAMDASHPDPTLTPQPPEELYSNPTSFTDLTYSPAEYQLVRSDDGVIRLIGGGSNETAVCDATGMKMGYYDPAPTIDPGVTLGDVVQPPKAKIE